MSEYDKELQTGTDEYEKAMQPKREGRERDEDPRDGDAPIDVEEGRDAS
jgi:hypothetical protein